MTSLCFIRLDQPWCADPYSDPPLGLLSVIAAAKRLSLNGKSLEIRLLDMAHEKDIPKSDIYASSACTLDYLELIKISDKIKKNFGSPIIVGGPHFDVFPEDYWNREIENLPFDIICRGEGEATIARAVDLAENKGRGVVTQKGSLLNLDEIPFPAREFLNQKLYFKPGKVFSGVIFGQGNSTTSMTSRGCPFNCGFCASPELHKRQVRYRQVDNVKQEIRLLQEQYGITELRFQDDCFTLNSRRFHELSAMLSKTGIKYRCSMRADQVDGETFDLLWNSGCREVGFGIESAEDNVLKLLKKKTTATKNEYALIQARKRGFRVRAFIMTGMPGETKNSADHMINFLERTRPDVVTLTSFIPLPGCDVYRNPESYGVKIIDGDWSKYDIALKWRSKIPFVHTILTATTDEMETNREKLKIYLFNKGMSNVRKYNAHYESDMLQKP